MRVYELAKQLEMNNKELLEKMHGWGFEVKSHSSALDDKTVRDVYQKLGKGGAAPASEEKKPAPAKPASASREPAKKATPAAPKPKFDPHAVAREAMERAKARRREMAAQGAETGTVVAPPPQVVTIEKPGPQEKPAIVAPAPATKPPVPPATVPPPASAPPAPPRIPAQSQSATPVARQAQPAPTEPAVERNRTGAPGPGRAQTPHVSPSPRPSQTGGYPPRRPETGRREGEGYRGPGPGGSREYQGQQRPGSGGPPPPRPRGDMPSRPGTSRGSYTLKQMPGMPEPRPPLGQRGRRSNEEPLLEEVKRPTRTKPTKKTDSVIKDDTAVEKERKRLLKEKSGTGMKIRPGRFITVDAIDEAADQISEIRKPVKVRSSIILDREKPGGRAPMRRTAVVEREPVVIKIHGDVTVAEFADKIQVKAADIISKGMEWGEMLTMNKVLPSEMCELLATEFNAHIEVIPEGDEIDVVDYVESEIQDRVRPRPPVVTVMGHVDHGKTTLLDTIRKTDIASGEFGGITQHIGAYRVETARGEIVFLDTPGHEAFTAMRARGASITDIVILVVAADDGLMPQTVEAINHAKAAKVPIVVAINKIDLPGAAPQKVRTALMQHSLVGEELGGETIICEVSAKAGTGIDHLLEMVLLQAEMMELKADPDMRASGVVIESETNPQRGTNATVLVERGTLRAGDAFVCGDVSGRVRAMLDEHDRAVEAALPAHPVRILGLDGCPQVGEKFLVLESERQARQIAQIRETRRRRQVQRASEKPRVTLESLGDYLNQDDKPKTLNIVLKGDVQGSVEAVSQSLQRLSTQKVTIQILHSGVGAVTESDVQLAMASDALIIGFNVRPDPAAADLAAQEGIDIKTYRVIYSLIEEIQAAMLGMLDKKYREVPRGKAEIRQVFRISRFGTVAGCYVTTGTLGRNDKCRLVRDGVVAYEGTISSLRRVKDDVATVQMGYECGLTLADFQDYKEGDIVETFRLEEVAQEL